MKKDIKIMTIDMYTESEGLSVIREYGKPRVLISPNPMQLYLQANPNALDPSYVELNAKVNHTFVFKDVLKELQDAGWVTTWQSSSCVVEEMERPTELYMQHPDFPMYMLNVCVDRKSTARKRRKNLKKLQLSQISVTDYFKADSYEPVEGDDLIVNEITVFTPARVSTHWIPSVVESLHAILSKNTIVEINPEEAEVNIVTISEGQYEVRSFSLEDANTSFEHPDLHYGDGFDVFHGSLLERISTEKKGLVLLHGEPGTGKTQYIRHLLKELCAANKAVLYAPPSVSATLAEPQMINFISNWILEESRDCILLIEDAEPLLESRSGGSDGRSTGITNLLNMTDGILNDILGLMVIATFNIDISKIDPALLRPGRLIARKEFRKLDRQQAETLATAIGADTEFEDAVFPMSIADFYNRGKAKKMLIHDYTDKRNTIGFR